jgi:2,5-diamino-6-(ribosylamino)-4(3H)-pyrimidinone 5'-phosphate reductase
MKRPYVVINCAMTADGKIALPSGKQLRISSEEDMQRVYMLRNKSDAVLVGINTVLSDDPKLTVKEKYVKDPKQPLRIVLDSNCKTPDDALVVNKKAKTIIFTTKQTDKRYPDNVEVIVCNTDKYGFIDLKKMLEFLWKRNIKKLMVEGGSTVIYNFLKHGLVDDFYIYIGPTMLGDKNAPGIVSSDEFEKVIKLKIIDVKKMGEGLLVHYRLI